MHFCWEHVDLEAGELKLPDTKTGAKVVHLVGPAIAVLCGIERQDDNPWVVAGRKAGSHLIDLQHPWRRIRTRAGLDDVRIHDFRHSCASWPDFLAAKDVIKRCNWLSFPLLPKPLDIAIYNPKSHSHRIHSNI